MFERGVLEFRYPALICKLMLKIIGLKPLGEKLGIKLLL